MLHTEHIANSRWCALFDIWRENICLALRLSAGFIRTSLVMCQMKLHRLLRACGFGKPQCTWHQRLSSQFASGYAPVPTSPYLRVQQVINDVIRYQTEFREFPESLMSESCRVGYVCVRVRVRSSARRVGHKGARLPRNVTFSERQGERWSRLDKSLLYVRKTREVPAASI